MHSNRPDYSKLFCCGQNEQAPDQPSGESSCRASAECRFRLTEDRYVHWRLLQKAGDAKTRQSGSRNLKAKPPFQVLADWNGGKGKQSEKVSVYRICDIEFFDFRFVYSINSAIYNKNIRLIRMTEGNIVIVRTPLCSGSSIAQRVRIILVCNFCSMHRIRR